VVAKQAGLRGQALAAGPAALVALTVKPQQDVVGGADVLEGDLVREFLRSPLAEHVAERADALLAWW
jgi:hypothetical protein